MNGMNRFHQKDIDHPFDMSALDGYTTFWLPQVDEVEKTHSTMYYEALKAIETTRLEQKKEKDDYVFIFGRGTIGPSSEEHLFEAMQQCMKYYGKDVNFVMVGKSFGVADTLAALKMFKPYHRKPYVRGLFLIDGFLPPSERRHISRRVGKERQFIVPRFAERFFNVVQKVKGTKGKYIDSLGYNKTVDQIFVFTHSHYYSEYSDGYKRRLLVSHFNMEEIVSAVPCIDINGDKLTLSKAIERIAGNYYPPIKRKTFI